jgi:alcohol dehydrogenase class IV
MALNLIARHEVRSFFSYSIPHSIYLCLILAHTVAVRATYLPDNEVKQRASLIPFITSIASQSSDDPREQAMNVSEAIDQLILDLRPTSTLQEYNVPQSDFESIIEGALPNGNVHLRYHSFI